MAYRNKYLFDKYGMTVDDYAAMALAQNGACKCCGQIPTGRDLHVDHDHKVAKLKILVRNSLGEVGAYIREFDKMFVGPTARADAKTWLLRKSVRGLLCWKCNAGLRAFKNRSDVCHNAGNYLEAYAARL